MGKRRHLQTPTALTRRPLPGRGVLASGVLASGVLAYALRGGWHHGSSESPLAKLLPSDLDALNSREVMNAMGAQLLFFGGFVAGADGWRRGRPPASLQQRVDLIAPSWKPGGRIDYAWPWSPEGYQPDPKAGIQLFNLGSHRWPSPLAIGAGTTMRSLANALERLGLRADDFDRQSRTALSEMLTWRLPAASERVRLDDTPDALLTLLVLSFDATPDCRAVDDCARPGPTNELLAATAAAFVRRRAREHGQRVAVIAQWEVAAAMRTLRADEYADVRAVGTPGIFENTAQIFEQMLRAHREVEAPPRECDGDGEGATAATAAATPTSSSSNKEEGDEDEVTSRLVLLAHPDHLRRAMRIGETTFAKAAKATRKAAATTSGGALCAPPPPPPRLMPALQPYRLDWPDAGAAEGGVATGAHLDLFANISARVHTAGEVVDATWRDAPHGYYPDGEPQRWAHKRDVWVCYEVWARAKGVATGVIST